MGLFDFFLMANDYEDRKVARYENGSLIVDTSRVYDSIYDYETAVAHPLYNEGKFIIVANYDDKEAAFEGHEKWVKKMTAPQLPSELIDVGCSEIKQFFGVGDIPYKKEGKNEN